MPMLHHITQVMIMAKFNFVTTNTEVFGILSQQNWPLSIVVGSIVSHKKIYGTCNSWYMWMGPDLELGSLCINLGNMRSHWGRVASNPMWLMSFWEEKRWIQIGPGVEEKRHTQIGPLTKTEAETRVIQPQAWSFRKVEEIDSSLEPLERGHGPATL